MLVVPVQAGRRVVQANPYRSTSRRESVTVRSEAVEPILPRKSSKFRMCKPYRKPTQVGGMNNPRRSRELWPRNSAK